MHDSELEESHLETKQFSSDILSKFRYYICEARDLAARNNAEVKEAYIQILDEIRDFTTKGNEVVGRRGIPTEFRASTSPEDFILFIELIFSRRDLE